MGNPTPLAGSCCSLDAVRRRSGFAAGNAAAAFRTSSVSSVFKEPRHHGACHQPLTRSPPPFLPTRKRAGFPVAIPVNPPVEVAPKTYANLLADHDALRAFMTRLLLPVPDQRHLRHILVPIERHPASATADSLRRARGWAAPRVALRLSGGTEQAASRSNTTATQTTPWMNPGGSSGSRGRLLSPSFHRTRLVDLTSGPSGRRGPRSSIPVLPRRC